MKLDFSTLAKALASFGEAVESAEDRGLIGVLSAAHIRTLKAGVIQNFEFTYELSWKMLRRYLIEAEGESEVASLSHKDLFRLGARKNVVADPELWFEFHRARNETSHTYDQTKADEVYSIAKRCLPEAKALLVALAGQK